MYCHKEDLLDSKPLSQSLTGLWKDKGMKHEVHVIYCESLFILVVGCSTQ